MENLNIDTFINRIAASPVSDEALEKELSFVTNELTDVHALYDIHTALQSHRHSLCYKLFLDSMKYI